MSKTYHAIRDNLVHALESETQPTFDDDGWLHAWCGETYNVDKARYDRGVEKGAVVTCVRCLNNEFQLRISGAVRNLGDAEDAQYVAQINATIGAAKITSVR